MIFFFIFLFPFFRASLGSVGQRDITSILELEAPCPGVRHIAVVEDDLTQSKTAAMCDSSHVGDQDVKNRVLGRSWSNSFSQHFVLFSLLVEQLVLATLGPFSDPEQPL
jgi:hypothetical protein